MFQIRSLFLVNIAGVVSFYSLKNLHNTAAKQKETTIALHAVHLALVTAKSYTLKEARSYNDEPQI